MQWKINHGRRRVVKRDGPGVAHDPDNLHIDFFVTHPFPDRVLSGKETPGDRIADDCDRLGCSIPLVKFAPCNEWYPNSRKVSGCNPVPLRCILAVIAFKAERTGTRTA